MTEATAAAEWRKGWTVVLTGMAGMSLAAMPTAMVGVMIKPLEETFHWSRALISSGPLCIMIMTVLLSSAIGVVIDKVGVRRVALAATVLFAGAVAAMSAIGNIWHWRGLWLVVGLAATAAPSVWIIAVSQRFVVGRGLAMAVALSGPGAASLLAPVYANWLLEHQGWRNAFLGLGLTWMVVVLPMVLFFLHDSGRSASSAAEPVADLTGYTPQEGLLSGRFWKLAVASFLVTGAPTGLVLNFVPILNSQGLPQATSAWVFGMMGFAQVAGGIFGGWALDRFKAGPLAAVASLFWLAMPIALLAAPGSVPLALAGVLIGGPMSGICYPAIAYLASHHLGQRSLGLLFGTIHAIEIVAVGVAPLLANHVFDVTRSYTPVLWAMFPVQLIAALMFATLGKYPTFAEDAKVASH